MIVILISLHLSFIMIIVFVCRVVIDGLVHGMKCMYIVVSCSTLIKAHV